MVNDDYAEVLAQLEETSKLITQYVPAGGKWFADLAECADPADGERVIGENITRWQAQEHARLGAPGSGRPRVYRIIRRVAREELVAVTWDDGEPLAQRLARWESGQPRGNESGESGESGGSNE